MGGACMAYKENSYQNTKRKKTLRKTTTKLERWMDMVNRDLTRIDLTYTISLAYRTEISGEEL